jgi:hypothetical protein
MERQMTKKELIQLASRALSLNLVIWSVASIVYVPSPLFAMLHYRNMASRTASQDYFYTYDFITLFTRLLLAAGLFMAAVWFYRCGPTIENFLSPSEE